MIIKRLSQQQEAIEHLKTWKVGALFMEPGTGKTRVAVDLVNSVNDIDFVLWIGPIRTIKTRNIIPSICEEIEKWGGFNSEVMYVGCESLSSSDRIYLNTLNSLKSAKNPFIIVDESLKIKNKDAIRTQRILQLSAYASYKIILNGTPLSKNLADIWPQMEFLSHKILNMTYSKYEKTFCEMTKVTKYYNGRSTSREYISGYANVDYLYSLIRHYVYECDLSLNIKQFYMEYDYQVDHKEQLEYDDIKDYYLTEELLSKKDNNIFLEMTQKMQHSYSCSESKFKIVDDIIKTYGKDNIIIFCKFISSREACSKRYPDVLCLSYQKESYGLNLQSYSHTIYFDKTWDYATKVQSTRRTYRTGQENNCHYHELTGNVGLEKLIDSNINNKESLLEYFKSKTIDELKKVL